MIKKLVKTFVPILFGVALYFITFALFHPYIVSGPSMEPTLNSDDFVLCYTSYSENDVSAGDIVICKVGLKSIIKRVVACPGDSLYIKDGILYVNDEKSPYNYEAIEDAGPLNEKITLSEGEYFCLGDNRNNSLDSREYGAFTTSTMKYLVKIIVNSKGVIYEH